jgi:hypothetical protein
MNNGPIAAFDSMRNFAPLLVALEPMLRLAFLRAVKFAFALAAALWGAFFVAE